MNMVGSTASRTLEQCYPGMPTSDGAGVKLLRVLHGAALQRRLDPWLMFDYFASDRADDYIAGFPDHPHRGFETITIMLEGRMLHRDSRGNQGVLEPGDVQWMSAARGLVHSEMPQQDRGKLAGYQLWINLPARHKMDEPRWQDIPASRIPRIEDGEGSHLRLIAGRIPPDCFGADRDSAQLREVRAQDAWLEGPLQQPLTEPILVEGHLRPGSRLRLPLPASHHAMVFALADGLFVNRQRLAAQALGVLGNTGDHVCLSGEGGFLVAAGRPLHESIAQMGPFVMNTREELMQALHDYQSGALG